MLREQSFDDLMDTIFECAVGIETLSHLRPPLSGQVNPICAVMPLLNGEEGHDCAGKAEDESQDSPKLAAVCFVPAYPRN